MKKIAAVVLSFFVLPGCGKQSADLQAGTLRLRPLPQSAEILFVSNKDTGNNRWEIYSMDAQGGNVFRITRTQENHFLAGVDPARRYIVATRGTEKKKRLWLLDLSTGKETPLTSYGNHAEGRTFSPDSEWIVFWMIEAQKKFSDIYKIRRDGTELTNLTNTPKANEFDPAWSKKGDRIAFTFNNGNPNRFVLKTMDIKGKNLKTIYDARNSVKTTIFPPGVYDPSWSPDDKWILVETPVSNKGENGKAGVWRILKIKADGSRVFDLTAKSAHAQSAVYLPSFSPDGKFIVFTSRYGPEKPARTSLNIFKMDNNGNSLEKLSNTPFWEQFAIWCQ